MRSQVKLVIKEPSGKGATLLEVDRGQSVPTPPVVAKEVSDGAKKMQSKTRSVGEDSTSPGHTMIPSGSVTGVRGAAKFVVENTQGLIVAEVGVNLGDHAYAMLTHMNIKTLVLVDAYLPTLEYPDDALHSQRDCQQVMLDQLAPWKGRIVFMFQKSVIASAHFPDEYFDFVYIDADHSFPEVWADINAWYPKVKVGGFLGGHDYNMLEVGTAIDQFVQFQNLSLTEFPEGEDTSDWIIRRNEKNIRQPDQEMEDKMTLLGRRMIRGR